MKLRIVRVVFVSAQMRSDVLCEETRQEKKERGGLWFSMCPSSLPLFSHQLLETISLRQIACPPSFGEGRWGNFHWAT